MESLRQSHSSTRTFVETPHTLHWLLPSVLPSDLQPWTYCGADRAAQEYTPQLLSIARRELAGRRSKSSTPSCVQPPGSTNTICRTLRTVFGYYLHIRRPSSRFNLRERFRRLATCPTKAFGSFGTVIEVVCRLFQSLGRGNGSQTFFERLDVEIVFQLVCRQARGGELCAGFFC